LPSAGSSTTTCLLAALRAAATPDPRWRRGRGVTDLAADVATRLQALLAQPARPDHGWSIDPPDGCRCDLCETLAVVLRDRARRGFDWPLAHERHSTPTPGSMQPSCPSSTRPSAQVARSPWF
jgi:hypothetical protein